MTLPLVLIFGNHRDTAGDQLVKNLIPKLAKEGYNRYCIEDASSKTEESLLTEITSLINLIKSKPGSDANSYLPSINLKRESLLLAKEHYYCTICIDDDLSLNSLSTCMFNPDLQDKLFRKTCPTRDVIMADHLFRMHIEKKGIIALFGQGHYKGLISRLKEKGLGNDDLICHFTQTFTFHSLNLNGFDLTKEEKEGLRKIESCVTTDNEINQLGNKILIEIKSKNRSVCEITENAQSRFLSEVFTVNFKALLKPQYYVDAILPVEEVNDTITQTLDLYGIEHHIKNNYLVIPNVNIKKVADIIWILPNHKKAG